MVRTKTGVIAVAQLGALLGAMMCWTVALARAAELAGITAGGQTVDGEADALARAKAASTSRDPGAALAIYRDLEARGSAAGALGLGLMSFAGSGVPVDHARACALFAEADARGNGLGTELLGDCMMHGDGRGQDYAGAAEAYRRAGERGVAISHCALGNLYRDGLGVPRDPVRSADLCRRSAELGIAEAQTDYGTKLLTGDGVTRDSAAAAAWLQKAADQGQANAQVLLGEMYRNGDGVAQDRERAADLWYAAALHGQTQAPADLARYYYLKGLLKAGEQDGRPRITMEPEAIVRCLFWADVAARTDVKPENRADMAKLAAMVKGWSPDLQTAVAGMSKGGRPPSR